MADLPTILAPFRAALHTDLDDESLASILLTYPACAVAFADGVFDDAERMFILEVCEQLADAGDDRSDPAARLAVADRYAILSSSSSAERSSTRRSSAPSGTSASATPPRSTSSSTCSPALPSAPAARAMSSNKRSIASPAPFAADPPLANPASPDERLAICNTPSPPTLRPSRTP